MKEISIMQAEEEAKEMVLNALAGLVLVLAVVLAVWVI